MRRVDIYTSYGSMGWSTNSKMESTRVFNIAVEAALIALPASILSVEFSSFCTDSCSSYNKTYQTINTLRNSFISYYKFTKVNPYHSFNKLKPIGTSTSVRVFFGKENFIDERKYMEVYKSIISHRPCCHAYSNAQQAWTVII